MAEKKISELNSLTGANAATGDLLPIVDVDANETKKITRAELFTSVSGLTTTGDVTVGGDLTVNGTTTTINTQTLDVEDKNITVAFGAPDAASADGAGLTVDGANATFTYVSSGDNWAFNKDVDVTGDITVTGTVDGRDVATDGSKLDGIEAGADVTDTANVTAAGALMDSELTDITAVKALDQGVATTDGPTFTNTQLAAIAETKGVTAVDVFVYDTSKDSDGGAWRKRTQGTSWYNETLNTATRGSRREFPAVAVIVAEATKVTIYDGDDPSLPMWMVFNQGVNHWFRNSRDVNSVTMLNGKLAFGTSGTANTGLQTADFLSDVLIRYESNMNGGAEGGIAPFPLSDRGTDGDPLNQPLTGSEIVSQSVNDVAMTVLPDAPIDPATGLPVPTIAVATDGGVSVIKDDGTVVDITGYSAAPSDITFSDNKIMTTGKFNQQVYICDIPNSDTTVDAFGTKLNSASNPPIFDNVTTSAVSETNGGFARGTGEALDFLYDTSPDLVSRITSTYNTGWMNGDIKGAFLSDTDDTDLVGGTDADRSVNGNDLTVNGTITRTPVATGADLVAYSGFSASNYLEQPYNADLDFGTGDFCMMGWVKTDSTVASTILHRSLSGGTGGILIRTISGNLEVFASNTSSFSNIGIGASITSAVWSHWAFLRRSGTAYVYLNGAETGNVSLTGDLSYVDAVMTVGQRNDADVPGDNLALLRISATAPTADQIRKIYEDEKFLFQENAQATLYGSSDAVTALAHDPVTELLHVGTSAGRSVFQGLRRVSNTTTAVGTAISASNGLVAEE